MKEILEVVTAPEYERRSFNAPDVYFAPGYGVAGGEQSWLSLVGHDGRWQMPLLTRITDGLRDATSPYGYAGVYAHESLSIEELTSAVGAARRVLQDLGVVSVFVRQTPLFRDPFPESPGRPVVSTHTTVAVPVADPLAAWTGMAGKCRTAIRKAESRGVAVQFGPASAQDLASGSPFRDLYSTTMRRRAASGHYYFSDQYFADLAQTLGDRLLLGLASTPDGEVVAASLFIRHGATLHYHLSGTSASGAPAGSMNALLWAAMQWAGDTGVQRLHLGGGVTEGDSLLGFKKSFGGELLNYRAFGVVIDQMSYDTAVAQRAEFLGIDAVDLGNSSYFPAYRGGA